jgi:hypothetical protein
MQAGKPGGIVANLFQDLTGSTDWPENAQGLDGGRRGLFLASESHSAGWMGEWRTSLSEVSLWPDKF